MAGLWGWSRTCGYDRLIINVVYLQLIQRYSSCKFTLEHGFHFTFQISTLHFPVNFRCQVVTLQHFSGCRSCEAQDSLCENDVWTPRRAQLGWQLHIQFHSEKNTISLMALCGTVCVFPGMRSEGSRFTLGVWGQGCVRQMLCLCAQPFATVRNRPSVLQECQVRVPGRASSKSVLQEC